MIAIGLGLVAAGLGVTCLALAFAGSQIRKARDAEALRAFEKGVDAPLDMQALTLHICRKPGETDEELEIRMRRVIMGEARELAGLSKEEPQ